MGSLKHIALVTASLGMFSTLSGQQAEVRAPGQMVVWAPMPVQPNPWIAPNKPVTRLSELQTKHAGEKNWTEIVVSDNLFHGAYISMGPGEKTPRRFHSDNRVWWIVQDGQIRFTIDGQEPIVASKGGMVQVPYRNIYSMETEPHLCELLNSTLRHLASLPRRVTLFYYLPTREMLARWLFRLGIYL